MTMTALGHFAHGRTTTSTGSCSLASNALWIVFAAAMDVGSGV